MHNSVSEYFIEITYVTFFPLITKLLVQIAINIKEVVQNFNCFLFKLLAMYVIRPLTIRHFLITFKVHFVMLQGSPFLSSL